MPTASRSSGRWDLFVPRLFDFSVWLAICLFLGGNVIFQGEIGGQKAFLEATDWGYALIPAWLIAVWASRQQLQASYSYHLIASLWRHLRALKPSQARLLIAATIIPLTALILRAVWNRYWSFTADWDLAIYGQACSHGLYSSLRDETTLLADHFEPLLALFVPLCSTVDAALGLLAVQTLCLAGGALGLVKLARLKSWSWPSTILAMLLYLGFAGNRTTYFYDFHVVAIAGLILPWLILSLLTSRFTVAAALSVAYVMTKETSALTLAGIGMWYVLSLKDLRLSSSERAARYFGGALTLLSFVTFFGIMLWFFPFVRDGRESLYFVKYYGHLGQSLTDVARNGVLKPWLFAETLLTGDRLLYLFKILSPFLAVVLLRPSYLLPIIPALLVNLLASNFFLHSAHFHYEAEIYPWLFVSVVLLSRDSLFQQRWRRLMLHLQPLLRFRKPRSMRVVWLTVMLCFGSGKALSWYAAAYPSSAMQISIRNELQRQRGAWAESKVAVSETLAPHLTGVRHLYLLDRWRDADWIVVAFPAGKGAWMHSIDEVETQIVPEIEKEFNLVYRHPLYPSFRIWQRRHE